ncbi:hypothetical protein BGZ73_006953 [Actinomortierella ambigua]|nr:hypothetical protein BGZ73_006953 [Actinomortierella ambigua]
MADGAGLGDKSLDAHGSHSGGGATTILPPKQSTSSSLFKEASQGHGVNLADYNNDEEDERDDDDDDDDELLAMPTGSQAVELYMESSLMDVEQSQSIPAMVPEKDSSMPPPPGPPARPALASGSLTYPSIQASSVSTLSTSTITAVGGMEVADDDDDDDELFSAEFMREFGSGSSFSGSSSNKSPYPRRQTLLSLTGERDGSTGTDDEDDTLGLNDLTISQRHTTRSGQPLDVSSTLSSSNSLLSSSSTMGRSSSVPRTAVATGTTFLPKFSSDMERFRASSLTQHSHSQDLSQYEELLEMTDRQSAMTAAKEASLLSSSSATTSTTTTAKMVMEKATVSADDVGDFWGDDDDEFQAMLQESYELQEQMDRQQGSSASASSSAPAERRKHVMEEDDRDIDQLLQETDRILQESAKIDARLDVSKKTRTMNDSSGVTGGVKRHEQSKTTASLSVPQHDYTLPPETGSFIKARNSRGQTLFLPKRPRVRHQQMIADLLGQDSPMGAKSLLSQPIHRMMDELEMEIKVRDQEAQYRVELEVQAVDQHMQELDTYGRDHLRREDLWVDKYRPKHYTDLMGDEYVNREVLSWIKEWDQCVFGRKYRKTAGPARRGPGGGAGGAGAGAQAKRQFQQEFTKRVDPLGRPDRKILLLTGPPGMGKTTMAHVIAKQAGYNIIEVNASDDRTAATIKGKIEAALEIQSIRGSDKPNLLIIDEIDGASSSGGDQSFIKLLVDIASVEAQPTAQKSGEGGLAATSTRSRGRKNQQHKRPLMRPIICICNDQYATVLRPLRTIAQIYQFRKPSVRSVVKRLQQICELEQLSHDTRACGMLYEMTEGDMRSCLNTLQFIKNKIQSSALNAAPGGVVEGGLTVEMLGKAAVGRKDQNKSLYAVWEELFHASYARKNRSALKVVDGERDGLVRDDSNAYVSRLVSLIQTNGEYDKLMQGCFENFLRMTFHDTAMSKVVESTEWIAFYDKLSARISSQFEYELQGYVGYSLVSFHRYFAGSVKQQKLEYPRKDYESYLTHKAHESIAQAVLLNLTPSLQRQYGKGSFATELLAPLLRILSPNMRPVNKQLIKADERAVLKRLVEVMIQFRLTFVQEKLEDGQFVYRLEPALEKLGNFAGIGLKNVMNGRYATRQLIAQEIEVELVRRQEALKEEIEAELASKGKGKGKGKEKAGSRAAATDSKGKSKKSGDGDQDRKEREAVDFFGRPITKPNDDKTSTTAMAIDVSGGEDEVEGMGSIGDRNGTLPTAQLVQHRVWYRFNEGFSNAVKAKVFMHELF